MQGKRKGIRKQKKRERIKEEIEESNNPKKTKNEERRIGLRKEG